MIRNELKDRLIETANNNGLEVAVDFLLSEAVECIHIFSSENSAVPRISWSQMGGCPILPEVIEWPVGLDKNGKQFGNSDFLAQLSFSEIPVVNGINLPKDGHLWMFIKGVHNNKFQLATIRECLAQKKFFSRSLSEVKKWSVAECFGLKNNRRFFEGCINLTFEIGISLPFGNTVLREVLNDRYDISDWETLANALSPSQVVGQIGGFAYSFEGHDLCRDNVLMKLGMKKYIASCQYNTLAELETSSKRIPAFIKNDEQLEVWKASYAKMRDQVTWIEEHKSQLSELRLLVRFDTNLRIGFSIGDSDSLFVFIRSSDLSEQNFNDLDADVES